MVKAAGTMSNRSRWKFSPNAVKTPLGCSRLKRKQPVPYGDRLLLSLRANPAGIEKYANQAHSRAIRPLGGPTSLLSYA
jgi:hypothetical protein